MLLFSKFYHCLINSLSFQFFNTVRLHQLVRHVRHLLREHLIQFSERATKTKQFCINRSGAKPKKNLGAIIGGTFGGIVFLGLLAALVIVFLRRRNPTANKRWTFHRDMMIRPTVPEIHSTSPTVSEYSTYSTPDMMEEGLPQDIPPAMRASPIGPRPLIRPPYLRDRPLPSAPLTSRQETIVERMEQVRHQMMGLERSPGPTQHIILDDMQRQMSWLQAQLGSPWARGLTDVTPLGFSHNLAH